MKKKAIHKKSNDKEHSKELHNFLGVKILNILEEINTKGGTQEPDHSHDPTHRNTSHESSRHH